MLRLLFIALIYTSVSSCSGGSNPDRELQQKAADAKQLISGVTYEILQKDNLQFDGTSVSGSGKIIALKPLNSTQSTAFKISVNLEDNGEVILHTYTDNKLMNGFDIKITRQGGKIKFELMSSGKTIDYSEIEGIRALNAIEPVSLSMDIHNSENPAHFILWKSSETTFDETTALLNSADEPQSTPGAGSGLFFGLTLKDARVSALIDQKPHVSH